METTPAPGPGDEECAQPVTANNGNGSGRPAPRPNFGDRLTEAVADRESQIVLGIDPDPAKLWPAAVEATSEARARLASTLSEAEDAAGGVGETSTGPSAAGVVSRLETAAAVLAHCRALVDAAAPAVVAVKPQLACFERLGAPGWAALAVPSVFGLASLGILVFYPVRQLVVELMLLGGGISIRGGRLDKGIQARGVGVGALEAAAYIATALIITSIA